MISSDKLDSPTARSSFRTCSNGARPSTFSMQSDSPVSQPIYRPVSTGARISMHTDASRNRVESINFEIKSTLTRLSNYLAEEKHNISEKLNNVQASIEHKFGRQHHPNCRLCDKKGANVVEVPCGHVAVCGDCLRSVYKSPKCLVCATYSRCRVPVEVAHCMLCQKRDVEIAIPGCGHASTCRRCLASRLYRGCPLCGNSILEITDIRWSDTPYVNKEQQDDARSSGLIDPGGRQSAVVNANERAVKAPAGSCCGCTFSLCTQ
eukprot:GEMP01022572.1.p1 GENE.GEMP01022572.1~~GEMP01022572.1.p1  ORF type:complete len:264 (+),score=46.39 GEMP01022572.1:256-1047(+)